MAGPVSGAFVTSSLDAGMKVYEMAISAAASIRVSGSEFIEEAKSASLGYVTTGSYTYWIYDPSSYYYNVLLRFPITQSTISGAIDPCSGSLGPGTSSFSGAYSGAICPHIYL